MKLPIKVINCIRINHDTTKFSGVEGVAELGMQVVYTYMLQLSICIEAYEYVYIDDVVGCLHIVSLDMVCTVYMLFLVSSAQPSACVHQ